MPRRTTQPKRVRSVELNSELSIALIIEWTGERVMYNFPSNSSSETNPNNKIYPKTIVKDAINIILNTATNVSEESKLKAFQVRLACKKTTAVQRRTQRRSAAQSAAQS